ncbi:MAG: alcohol acetyltransferase [Evtepia sp.]
MTNDWYKLDYAGDLFSATQSEKNSSVFRIAVVMTSPVDAVHLQKAADTVARRFPMFMVKIHKGVFWNYMDKNTGYFTIEKEEHAPCRKMDRSENNGYQFKILYFQNRISLEISHVLADGRGAMEFLKSLLYYYLSYCGYEQEPDCGILLEGDPFDPGESEDSFEKYSANTYYERIKSPKAYRIKGTSFESLGTNVVHGIVSAGELTALAQKNKSTITAYLAALLIHAIYQTRVRVDGSKLPIVVAVPVNLRKQFPSKTLRNFFGVVHIGGEISDEVTFDELVVHCTKMLKHKTEKYYLQNIICSNVALESSVAKTLPLIFKKRIIRLCFRLSGGKKSTISLTNVGTLQLPEHMQRHISQMEAMLYPNFHSPINCGICTLGDKLTISFSRNIVEADILQYFFSYLSEQLSSPVELYSNDWGNL